MTVAEIFTILNLVLKVSLVIFMVGNLLDMGLRLEIRAALAGLRNLRFVALGVLWGFVLCPALAWTIARIVPLHPGYASGLVLLGMVPCAPFLPQVVERARGDTGHAAALMLLASVVTVAYVPAAVPVMVEGLRADAWTIAKPLLFFVLTPLAAGFAIQRVSARAAARLIPYAKRTTGIVTILMLVLCAVVYGRGFIESIGSLATLSQVLFFSAVTAGPYVFGFGLRADRKSVLALGMSTRNLGAAFAPLLSVPDADPRAVLMVALGVPLQILFSFGAARLFARWSRGGDGPPVRGV
jgi:BASS family bile acid:Na+ symporter